MVTSRVGSQSLESPSLGNLHNWFGEGHEGIRALLWENQSLQPMQRALRLLYINPNRCHTPNSSGMVIWRGIQQPFLMEFDIRREASNPYLSAISKSSQGGNLCHQRKIAVGHASLSQLSVDELRSGSLSVFCFAWRTPDRTRYKAILTRTTLRDLLRRAIAIINSLPVPESILRIRPI